MIDAYSDEEAPGFTEFPEIARSWAYDKEFSDYITSKHPINPSPFAWNLTILQAPNYDNYQGPYDDSVELGLAACNAKNEFFTGADLKDALNEVNFQGRSGRVKMDPTTGGPDLSSQTFKVWNVVTKDVGNGVFRFQKVEAATLRPLGVDEVALSLKIDTPLVYSNGRMEPPAPLPPIEGEVFHTIGPIGRGVALALAVLLMLSSVALGVWTWVHKSAMIIKASQPFFLVLICFGVFLMGMSAVPLAVGYPNQSVEVLSVCCMAKYWLFILGFGLTFATLFAKLWRVVKIMNNASFRRIEATVLDVLIPCLALLGVDFILLTSWQATYPYKFAIVTLAGGQADEYGR